MKDAYYFPHDTNAIQDPKLMYLLKECGLAGVGFYWVCIEILHQQQWGAIGHDQYLAFKDFYFSFDKDRVPSIIASIDKVLFDSGLLKNEENLIFSDRVKKNIADRQQLSEKGKENALKRWGANAKPKATQCNPNAIKERKGKERERDARPLNAQEVTDYARSIGFTLNGQHFIDTYEKSGWVYGKSRLPVKDWKACVRTWKTNSLKNEEAMPNKKMEIIL